MVDLGLLDPASDGARGEVKIAGRGCDAASTIDH
jgi:hypothetical protein